MAINNGEIFGIKKTSESDNEWTWLPTPAKGGIVVTDEPIWAANTGRSSTGKMIGDIVAWKVTVEVAWPPLTFAQAKSIRNAIKGAGEFFDIAYYDLSTSDMVKKTVYCGNIPRALYSLADRIDPASGSVVGNYRRYSGIAIKFVEQ